MTKLKFRCIFCSYRTLTGLEFKEIGHGRYDPGIRVGYLVARDMIAVHISEDLAGNWIRLRFPDGAFLP
jgi:hypothetical protein